MKKSESTGKGIAKGAAYTLGALAALVLLLIVLILLPPVRGALLREAFRRAGESLPGELHARSLSWPRPGRIEGRDLLWTIDGDSLAAAARLVLEVDLSELLRKDIHVRLLEADVGVLDAGLLAGAFPADGKKPAKEKDGGPTFPRKGSLAGVPSVAVDRLDVKVLSLRLGGEGAIERCRVRGGADIRSGGAPILGVEELSARDGGGRWALDSLSLSVDMGEGSVAGRGGARMPGGWPLFFRILPEEEGRFHLDLSTEPGARREGPYVSLAGQVGRGPGGAVVTRAKGDLLTPGSEELRRFLGDGRLPEDLPALEGVRAVVEGAFQWGEELSWEASAVIEKNSWLDGGELAVRSGGGLLELDTLRLHLPDLDLRGRAEVRPDSLDVRARVTVSGGRWLESLRPGAHLPAGLTAEIEAAASGPSGAPVSVALDVRYQEISLLLSAEVERGEATVLRVPPIRVRQAGAVERPADGGAPGRIQFTPEGKVDVENLRVTGALGEATLSGSWRAGEGGEVALSIGWRDLPSLLLSYLSLDPAGADSIRARWRREGPFRVDLDGSLSVAGGVENGSVAGSFRLPGPAVLAPLLPPAAAVDDLGHLRGEYALEIAGVRPSPHVVGALDLGETEWLDSARVLFDWAGGSFALDSVLVRWEDLHVDGAGESTPDGRAFAGRVGLIGGALLRRFLPGPAAGLDPSLRIDLDYRQSTGGRRLDLAMEGGVGGVEYEVPRMEGTIDLENGRWQANVTAPDGFRVRSFRADRLAVRAAYGEGRDGISPATITVDLLAPDLAWSQTSTVRREEGWSVRTEMLDLAVGGRTLTSAHPFDINLLPGEGGVRVSGLELAGSLGALRLDGFAHKESVDVTGRARFDLPEKPEFLIGRLPVWAEQVSADFHARTESVGAEARVTGLALSDKTDLDGTVHLSAAGGDLALTFEVHDEGKTILHGGADLPFTLTPYPFRFEAHDGPISADARFAAFPLPLSSIGIETPDPARWDGTVLLGGSAGSPTLSVDGRVAFPGWPRMSRYWADVKADLSSSPDAASPGLSVSFTLESEERALITGEAEYPLVWSLAPPQAVVPDEGVLGLSLRGDAVPLEEFDAFLPAHVGLAGMIDLRFSAEGDVRDPRLDGAIASKEITVTSSEGTRVSSKLDVKVGGSASRLSAEGNVEILSGVIRIPDTPKDLHPEEGTAVLWGNGLAVGGEETEDAPPPAEAEEAAGAAERTFDLDVNLVIPSGLWIRGRGLDVELAGDLELVQKGPYPTVTGTLEALRGRLLFLGRTFFVERGTVIFYGEDEIDPSLDLLLTTHVESMLIRILFQGTAKKPEITLQSEPEMTEGDIMSVLLFGRTLDELSSDQTGFLQKRAADVAASLGTSQLEARLSRQLGVDMVTIGKGKGGNGKTSLIVGKYLSRNVLLKYEQALEESSVFFINLEYFLTRHLKLETLIGRQSQSALEVNWSKDY